MSAEKSKLLAEVIDYEQIKNVWYKYNELSNIDPLAPIEIEFRIGSYSKFDKRFVPGTTKEKFTSMLNNAATRGHELTRIMTVDYYPDVEGKRTHPNKRFTKVLTKTGEVLRWEETVKDNITNVEYRKYGLRGAIAREITEKLKQPRIPDDYVMREKNRTVVPILDGAYEIHMTEVTVSKRAEGPEKTKTVYEIELEIVDPDKDKIGNINYALEILMKLYQNTRIPYTVSEHKEVIELINTLIGVKHPETINTIKTNLLPEPRDIKLSDIVSTPGLPGGAQGIVPYSPEGVNYYCSPKADGVGYFIVIDKGSFYQVRQPDKVIKIFNKYEDFSAFGTIVVQGEVIPDNNVIKNKKGYEVFYDTKLKVLLFDVLFCENTIATVNTYEYRLSLLSKFVDAFSALKLTYVSLTLKDAVPFTTRDEFYTAVRDITVAEGISYPYETDGLIFTPNIKYNVGAKKYKLGERKLTEHPDIVKWKPPEKLTIDLSVKTKPSPSGSIYSLYTFRRGEGSKMEEFIGSNEFRFSSDEQLEINDMIENTIDGTIYEFKWDGERLVAIRLRDDKILPNSNDVAGNIWYQIHKPVTLGIMDGTEYGLQARYFSRIKREIFDRVSNIYPVKENLTLLSIGAGRGGDINKWIDMRVTKVILVEPDQENRKELISRLLQHKLDYIIIPIEGQRVNHILNEINKYLGGYNKVDIISYMLSLSFFNPANVLPMYDAKIIKFLNSGEDEMYPDINSVAILVHHCLKPGGIFTSFSIDGNLVEKAINYNQDMFVNNGIVITGQFKQFTFDYLPDQITYPDTKKPLVAKSDMILIDIPNTIVTKQYEYRTNIDALYWFLKESTGLEIVERSNIDASKEIMTDEEMILSNMYSWDIAQKK